MSGQGDEHCIRLWKGPNLSRNSEGGSWKVPGSRRFLVGIIRIANSDCGIGICYFERLNFLTSSTRCSVRFQHDSEEEEVARREYENRYEMKIQIQISCVSVKLFLSCSLSTFLSLKINILVIKSNHFLSMIRLQSAMVQEADIFDILRKDIWWAKIMNRLKCSV